MYFKNTPIKLANSRQHGAGTELFIVEGDSAASAVTSLRDGRFQAVLPMQGKPLNALKASVDKVKQYPLFNALVDSLDAGVGDGFDASKLRFERIVLLFDPDADGIHSGALMLMFFYKFMRPLLEMGKVLMVHPPWVQFEVNNHSAPIYAYSEAQSRDIGNKLTAKGFEFHTQRYRGLAGIDRDVLVSACIAPETRVARVMAVSDAQVAIEVFGGRFES